jgi:hypothetical protein
VPSELERAVLNNARWCEAVCTAHGGRGESFPGLWLNRRPSPRFYPNAITLTPDGTVAQLAAIAELVDLELPAGWGVKDSFCTLELAGLGFRVLFEAEWLRRTPAPLPSRPGLSWSRVATEADLDAWEASWAKANGDTGPRLFPPALLNDDDIAVIRVDRGGLQVGGVIVNRAAGVLGLSNAFSLDAGDQAVQLACLDAATGLDPGLDLVTYDSGAARSALRALGFQPLGPLRIWIKL